MLASNKILIKRIKHNDSKAFEQLFKIYSAKVYNFCIKFYLTKEEAEEIVQQAFIAIWENRQQIDENKSFLTYLFSISKNCIINTLKKKAYHKGFIEFTLNKDKAFSFITENEILFNELNVIVNDCIKELPEKRREIFILSRKNGLSYKEIAKKLSITESTVNTQITKSIEFLKQRLEEIYS